MALPLRLLAGMVFFVLTTGAIAQTGSDPTTTTTNDPPTLVEEPKVLQLIEVTGYRIKRMDIEGPAPVLVFDRVDLEQAGINTLQEFANYLPINFPEDVGIISDIGAAGFDLRGIGVDNTLTLVNGLRVAPYAQLAENAVDINSIPVSAIERIEILKDGASAIYGADAIAGVVNIILRSRYNGLEVSTGYGVSEEGDGDEVLADLVAGRDTGRGSIMFSLSVYDREPQAARDRDWSSDLDYSDIGGPNVRSYYSSPPGFWGYSNDLTQADPECGTDPEFSSVGAGRWGAEWGEGCRYNIMQHNDLFFEFERLGASLSGRYEFSGNLSFFGDILFSDVEGKAELAPTPISGSPEIETIAGYPYVPADHPGNPFGVEGEVLYRAIDTGNRTYTSDATSWRAVLGLEGLWGDWDWKLSALTSKNEVEKIHDNLVLVTRFQLALLGLGGPSGDQWYNPFGYQPQNDPGLIDWLTTSASLKDTTRENSIDVVFSRHFGTLPGGPVGVAAGLQYREQELDQSADELLRSGDVGPRHVPISADREIGSAYIEFSLPLLESLEAQLALRYEDYSDMGSDSNPKIALRWQPLPSLMFRASWSTSFKPPAFLELYEPANQDWDWYRDLARCEYTGALEDCDWRLYRMEFSGNPDLDPEDGESWFAGMVWTPEYLPGLDFQLDFWKFSHEGRIHWLPGQFVLNKGGDFGIVREPAEPDGTPGRIVLVKETYVNSEEFETQGIDTTIRYRWQTESAGDFRAGLMHTYVDEWIITDSPNEEVLSWGNLAGGFGFAIPIPHHRANLNVSWDKGAHAVAANFHYTGSYEHFRYVWVDGEETDEFLQVPSHTTLDLQYSYTFKKLKNAKLRLGCNNVTDEDPPFDYRPWNEPFHDGRGRFFYIRWQQPIR